MRGPLARIADSPQVTRVEDKASDMRPVITSLPVSNLQDAIRFYTRIVGLRLCPRGAGANSAKLVSEGTELWLTEVPGAKRSACVAPIHFAHLTELAQRLLANQVVIDVTEESQSGRYLFADPDGNRIVARQLYSRFVAEPNPMQLR